MINILPDLKQKKDKSKKSRNQIDMKKIHSMRSFAARVMLAPHDVERNIVLLRHQLNILLDDIVNEAVDGDEAVNAVDEAGNSALHYACLMGSSRCSDFLLENGANINATNAKMATVCVFFICFC